jgi:putative peptidoglycan lipid II flippase
LPNIPNIDVGLGAVGLTLSAGLAGWVEFLLLRWALQKRIGSTALPNHYPTKIWAAAFCAAGSGWAARHFVNLHFRWLNLGMILGVFGVVYALITLATGLPEARSLLRRGR